jgi:hypothetical protein
LARVEPYTQHVNLGWIEFDTYVDTIGRDKELVIRWSPPVPGTVRYHHWHPEFLRRVVVGAAKTLVSRFRS